MAREVSVTFIDAEGNKADEIVEASNTGMDITLSSAGGVKLVLSTAQMTELINDRSDWPQAA